MSKLINGLIAASILSVFIYSGFHGSSDDSKAKYRPPTIATKTGYKQNLFQSKNEAQHMNDLLCDYHNFPRFDIDDLEKNEAFRQHIARTKNLDIPDASKSKYIDQFLTTVINETDPLSEKVFKIYQAFSLNHESTEDSSTLDNVLEAFLKNGKVQANCYDLTGAIMESIRLTGGRIHFAEVVRDSDGELVSIKLEKEERKNKHCLAVYYEEDKEPLSLDATLLYGMGWPEIKVMCDCELWAQSLIQKENNEDNLKKAIMINPFDAYLHYRYGLLNLNEWPTGIDEMKRAYELDPLDFRYSYGLALAYFSFLDSHFEKWGNNGLKQRTPTKDEQVERCKMIRELLLQSLDLYPEFTKAQDLLKKVDQKIATVL